METEICRIRIGRKRQGECRCYGRVGARLVADLVQRCPEFAQVGRMGRQVEANTPRLEDRCKRELIR